MLKSEGIALNAKEGSPLVQVKFYDRVENQDLN